MKDNLWVFRWPNYRGPAGLDSNAEAVPCFAVPSSRRIPQSGLTQEKCLRRAGNFSAAVPDSRSQLVMGRKSDARYGADPQDCGKARPDPGTPRQDLTPAPLLAHQDLTPAPPLIMPGGDQACNFLRFTNAPAARATPNRSKVPGSGIGFGFVT